ncbi:MAG TPA: sugar transferase [Candidatus Saccharimonadales bacterium]|nr:sugar transferase [Candidatus Saccharimonadales bacterium]
MKNNVSLFYNIFLIVGDFLALIAAFIGAYVLRVSVSHKALDFPVHAHTYISVFLVLLPFWILIFALLGLYSPSIHEKRFSELGRLLVGSFIGMLFVVFWDFLAPKPILPARLVPILGFALAFIFLVAFRNIARLIRIILFRYGIGITNILIVGNTRVASELIESLHDSRQSGYRIVGVVGKLHNIKSSYKVRVFSSFHEAALAVGPNKIHSIVQTELYASPDKNDEVLTFAQQNHISYRFIPGNTELFVGNIDVELFRSAIPVIAVHQTALLGWGRIVKRLFDLSLGVFLTIVLSPFILLVAILLVLSGGQVFLRQTRLTRFNQRFRVFKFRTHKVKYNGLSPEAAFAKMGKPELAIEYRANGDFLKGDPRVTAFGKFLRKTSLDELPQLFNVLKGDLSLVGPRALVPEELDAHEKRHAILSVKSGLTGLAQVSGRRNITFDERRQLDMFYVQNWSFWFDLIILAKTVRVILTGEGAE